MEVKLFFLKLKFLTKLWFFMKNTYLVLLSVNLLKGLVTRARNVAFCNIVTSSGYSILFLIKISEGVEASLGIFIKLFFVPRSSCLFEGLVLRIDETFEKIQTVEFSTWIFFLICSRACTTTQYGDFVKWLVFLKLKSKQEENKY